MRPVITTVGHSTRTADTFIELLREAGIELLVDVRAFPSSRRNPQFNSGTLAQVLARVGIGYRHAPALGGRRQPDTAASRPDGSPNASPNGGWREPAFRAYADYALSAAFAVALDQVLRDAGGAPTAIMCAEAAWQSCHRRIIADHLVARGAAVRHVVAAGRIEPAVLTPGAAVRADRTVIYPPDQPRLL